MTLLDERGRLLGRLNLIDLLVVVVLCALVAAAYVRLTASYRVAPPFALPQTTVRWAEVELQLPQTYDWICDAATSGSQEHDPRSGDLVAEVLSCSLVEGLPHVRLRVCALEDTSARLLFKNDRLVPGRTLRIETENCILDGVVARIESISE